MTGRPTDYTADLAIAICERISNGESLRTICASEGMPSRTTVFRWIGQYGAFCDQYKIARSEQADTIFDECLTIADEAGSDWQESEDGTKFHGDHVQRARLRIDTRKWMAGKLRPKVYGDKVDVAHDVSDALSGLLGGLKPQGAPIATADGEGSE